MRLVTLRKRAEFLRIRGGDRWASTSFVLETRPSEPIAAPEPAGGAAPARFGFTVTRKLGSAVVRNRIRRRLKAAVAGLLESHARPGHDYVLVARAAAFDRPFAELKKELEAAFHRVHHARDRMPKGRRPR